MRAFFLALVGILALGIGAAVGDYAATQGSGTTFKSFVVSSVHYAAAVLTNSAGNETGTASVPLRTDPTGTTPQPVSGTVAATQSGTWTVQPGNTANSTAWLVTGTGGAFPSTQSGTWTVQPGNTANTTPWLTSISQGGSTATVGTYGSAPGAVAALNVNASVTNTNANGQATMANSSPVVIASNQTSFPVTVAAGSAIIGKVGIDQTTPGTTNSVSIGTEPCTVLAKTNLAFSVAADSVLIAGTSAKKTYICSFSVIAQAAEIINLVGGTGSTCGTNKVALMGSTTDANGLSFAANGGLTLGNGLGTVVSSTVNADDLCITLGGTNRVAGNVTYVQN